MDWMLVCLKGLPYLTDGKVCDSIDSGLTVEGQDLIAYLCYTSGPHALHLCFGIILCFRAALVACGPRSHVSGKMLYNACILVTER